MRLRSPQSPAGSPRDRLLSVVKLSFFVIAERLLPVRTEVLSRQFPREIRLNGANSKAALQEP